MMGGFTVDKSYDVIDNFLHGSPKLWVPIPVDPRVHSTTDENGENEVGRDLLII